MIIGVDPGIHGAIYCRAGLWKMRDLDKALAHLATLGVPLRFVVENAIYVGGNAAKATQTTQRNFGVLVHRLSQVGTVMPYVEPRHWQAALGVSKGRGEKGSAHKRRIHALAQRVTGLTFDVDVADAVAIWYFAEGREAQCAHSA